MLVINKICDFNKRIYEIFMLYIHEIRKFVRYASL
jgi:hypothetical protein